MASEPQSAGPTTRDRLAMAVMVSGGLWMAFIFTAIAPILSTMAVSLRGGIDPYWVGQLTMTIPDIGIIVGGPIAGMLIGRIGARRVALYSLTLFGIFGSAGLIVDDGATMLATRLMLGFTGAGIATSTTTLIGIAFAGEKRARALGYWSAVGAAGGVFSILLAGRIAAAAGWQAVFSLYALVFIAVGAGAASLPTAHVRPEKTTLPRLSLMPLWSIYAIMIPVYIVVFMTGVQVSFLLADDAITDSVTQSWIIGSASVGSAIGAWSFGWVRPKFGPRMTFIIFMTAMTLGNLIMPTTTIPYAIALGAALNGMGGGMANPHFSSILIERAPILARGRAIGLYVTTMFAGEFLNPFIMTPLRSVFDIHGAFIAVALMASALVVLALARQSPAWTSPVAAGGLALEAVG